jgi:hypothetical protein
MKVYSASNLSNLEYSFVRIGKATLFIFNLTELDYGSRGVWGGGGQAV